MYVVVNDCSGCIECYFDARIYAIFTGVFSIDSNMGVITLSSSLDRENRDRYAWYNSLELSNCEA